ncbi:MAG TPA: DUF305 domain-containing protein [Coleofasciculaceae cyanobacterium]
MNKKLAIYGLLGLLAASTLTALVTTHSNKAEAQRPARTPPSDIPNTRPHGMGMGRQADQHFIIMMIPHHQGAIDMAELALEKAQRPELKKLAEAIQRDQNREIDEMQTWYKQWYGTDVPDMPMQGMGMGMGMNSRRSQVMPGMPMHSGMMHMTGDLTALNNASDFDLEFIRQMIPHHQSAVMMAQMVLTRAEHPEIRNLAESIIKSQTAEIEQMQQWEKDWSR